VPPTKYYSRDQIKKDVMGGTCGTYGERRSAYNFGRYDNIKMNLEETGLESVGQIHGPGWENWRSLVHTAMNLWVSIKLG